MNKKWEYYEPNENVINKIAEKFNISKLLAKILINREIEKEEEINIFLNPTRNDFYDPFLFLDMEKAVNRILKAIEKQEKVIEKSTNLSTYYYMNFCFPVTSTSNSI